MSNKASVYLVKSNKQVEDTKSSKMGKKKEEKGGDLSEERDLGEIFTQSITR